MRHASRRHSLFCIRKAILGPLQIFRRAMASSSGRSYNDAIDALNSLQTPHSVIEARRKAGIRPDAASMREMRVYLNRIGYTPKDLDRLNIVHVAGTKGKGSACAFVDSILAQYRQKRQSHGAGPRKTGLFISPHLVAVRERIRIDSAPISEELFAKYFFDVWERLGSSSSASSSTSAATPTALEADDGSEVPHGTRPLYGRFLTLMSWHAFLQEGVDAAVYETGIGGEFDATNLVERPAAAGISTLGIDHVFVLGDSVDKIAWHKAGIMKRGSPAFTVEQVAPAAAVLRERALERGVDLIELPVDPRLERVAVRPDARFQKKNASLAVALAEALLSKLDVALQPGTGSSSSLPQEFVDGLEQTVFRGRCEVKVENKITWYLDGAHTIDSLKMSSRWFAQETANCPGPRVMIFNQQSRSEAVDFLDSVHASARQDAAKPAFDHVVFCTNVTYARTGYKRDFVNHQIDPTELENLTVQRRFADKWSQLDPAAKVVVLPSIEEALDYARHVAEDARDGESVRAYVTGSLHLVGGALGILEQADAL